MKKFKLTALLLLSLGLTACGGGSGGGDSTASTDNVTDNVGGLDNVIDLDRCIEQALFNGATTGAEALNICMGGDGSPSTDGGDIATPKYQSVLVKGMGMDSADKILSRAVSPHSPVTTALMICDNSVVTSNRFDNAMIEKSSVLNEWRGDKQYAGYYKVSVDGRDDNCLVQATDYIYSFPQGFYMEATNTIYRKGKVAHIDMISTLAMARLMDTRSYTIIEDILEGQDRTRYGGFDVSMHKGNFDQYRTELPSNEDYETAEKAIIDEIKVTPQYAEAAGVIDGIIADTPSTDELLDAYNNVAERAKLLAALHGIIEDCKIEHGYSATCSTENIITMYSEGNDFKTAFGL